MPIRNPFRRTGGPEVVDDAQRAAADRASQKTPVAGTKPIEVTEPAEYKLCGMCYLVFFPARAPCLCVETL